MALLNNYIDWLQEVDIDEKDYESASDLVHSLRNVCECGLFKTAIANGKNNGWIVSACGTEDNLHLFTPKQVSAFIRHIEVTLCEGMDAEIYSSYKHNMLKDD